MVWLTMYVQGQFQLAPSVVASGGQFDAMESLTVSWTIGELAVSTLTGENLILTQGFQQPLGMGTGIVKTTFEGTIYVYPNPVANELFIRFDTERTGDYVLELKDVTGRILIQTLKKPIHPGDIIEMKTSHYPPGIYFLQIISSEGRQVYVRSIQKS